jgi:hypothetical protein
MNGATTTWQKMRKTAPPLSSSFSKSHGSLLQRRCAGSETAGIDGQCVASQRTDSGLQPPTSSSRSATPAPPIVQEVFPSPGQPPDAVKRPFREPRFGHDFSRLRIHPSRTAGGGGDGGWSLDVLSNDSADPDDPTFVDQTTTALDDAGPDAGPAASDAGIASDAGAPAVPVNLKQIVTAWVPGPSRYGFQLSFQCSSSSGQVTDLQAQAPNLTWREVVTYTRNDFSHRINPPSPTILPPGGVSFSTSSTTVLSPNLLQFNTATDTHWTPTSAVRAEDYALVLASPRPLPAIMESSQVYQFSPNGSTWTTFAGPFTLRRTLERLGGALQFTTDKIGINRVVEAYKP